MHISISNSKLGDKIPSLNLPAVKTCRANAPCKKGCYACKGTWLYPNVQNSLNNNLKEFLADSEKFFNDIIKWINNDDITYKFFRWFSSGDIVNKEFFEGMIKTAKICKDTKFLCFTKKFEIVNDYLSSNKKIPSNLKIVFSAWDNTFKVENPNNLPMTYIFFNDTSRNAKIPEFAIPCTGSCKNCKACWNLKKGQAVYFKQH